MKKTSKIANEKKKNRPKYPKIANKKKLIKISKYFENREKREN